MTHRTSIINETIPLSDKDCIYIADRNKSEFTYPLHKHKEYELNFVMNGSGLKRIVGDSIEIIGDYDLVLIASKDLEHVWEQGTCESKPMREITIQFSADMFSADFINKDQFKSISDMLENAKKGLSFPMPAIMRVYKILNTLAKETQGFYSMMSFMTILYELSLFNDQAHTLSSSSFANVDMHSNSRRISKIQKYIGIHYREEIRLDQLANLIGMTPIALSRFYKNHTMGNISDYIIDLRLGHASRLLVNSDESIYKICYDCGFNNLSNFNRLFKKKKKYSPKEFRENYRKVHILV